MLLSVHIISRSYLIVVIMLLVGLWLPVNAFSYSCLPTCTDNDGKMLRLNSTSGDLFVNTLKLGIIAPLGSSSVEIGVFDGDGGGNPNWDTRISNLRYILYADPNGDGTGAIEVARWSGDGSFGKNIGSPMPDNGWFADTVDNVNSARGADGLYRYSLLIEYDSLQVGSSNAFKLRSDGVVYIFPLQNVAFQPRFQASIIYPHFDLSDPNCLVPGINRILCNIGEPGCCLNDTTYDGDWTFYFIVPENTVELQFYDGDFDYNSAHEFDLATNSCIRSNIVDTDDPNTPNTIPSFAAGTNAQPEGANGEFNPADDSCLDFGRRTPPITYDLVDPFGNVFNNPNTSGHREWELFNLSTAPFDPTVMDIHVDSLEPGVWALNVRGVDASNLFLFRFTTPIYGQDEGGGPAVIVPARPTSIPTMGEWAMIFFAVFAMMAGIYYIRQKKGAFIE